ncbi:MAG: gliding motility-associated C-terminal domain-containing protein [Bacteroidales bacterium]
MVCPDTAEAKMQVSISGGYPPYEYHWSEGTPTFGDPSIVYFLTDGQKELVVYDSLGCMLEQEFTVKAYPIPKITLFVEPDSVIYIQKPFASFSFENPTYDSLLVDSFALSSWNWYMELPIDSSANTQSNYYSPNYTYRNPGKYNIKFEFTTFYGCPGDTTIDLEVKPVKLKFPNAITPNDDGFNERFEITEDDGSGGGDNNGGDLKSTSDDPIDLSKYYISNKLTVFNRWGEKVFETDNYQNDWDGDNLQDGTYFFILV